MIGELNSDSDVGKYENLHFTIMMKEKEKNSQMTHAHFFSRAKNMYLAQKLVLPSLGVTRTVATLYIIEKKY